MGNPGMTPSEITRLHQSLAGKIKQVLHFAKLEIAQPPQRNGNWNNASVGAEIAFELLYVNTYQEQTAQRDRGGGCSVFALHPGYAEDLLGSRYWVTWHEKWQVGATRRNLDLCTAAWTVFAGPQGQEKQQVIRAEWDQLPRAGRRSSGQPHWHVDRFPQIQLAPFASTAASTTSVTGLMFADTSSSTPALSDLHLAMGAWHATESHPACWQRSAGRPDDLVQWGLRTLEYLKSELSDRP